MRNQRLFWGAIAIAAWFLAGGVRQSASVAKAGRSPVGEKVRGACPAVPNDAAPIAGLQTAWAIRDPKTETIRLVFGDHDLACRDLPLGGPMHTEPCVASWEFAFTLSPAHQTPGVYNLHDYEANYAESAVIPQPDREGCQSEGGCMGMGMGAAGGAKGPDSTVEIYSVSDECVTGRIHRLERGASTPPPPDFTGTFQALVCTSSE